MSVLVLDKLRNQLEELSFNFIPGDLDSFLHEESNKDRSFIETLSDLLEKEISQKRQRAAKTRVKLSRMPEIKRLEDFEFETGNVEGISQKQINELATLTFIERKENVILMGPSGLGKSHLLLSLCQKACMNGYTSYYLTCAEAVEQLARARQQKRLKNKVKSLCKPHLLAIDEIGYHKLDPDEAQLLFQLVAARYEKGSIILTTNKSFGEWAELMGEKAVATATLDRLLHHSNVFILKGESYRLRNRIKHGLVPRNMN